MEFSNPAYLEELGKRIIFKKKIVQIGPSVQILQIWGQKYFIYFCQKWSCLLFFFVIKIFKIFTKKLKIEARDKLRKMLSGKKLFDDFPTWQGPWIRKLYSNAADLHRANF